MLRIKNGAIKKIDDTPVPEKLPANVLERVAKGLCSEAKIKADTALALNKALTDNIKTIQAELNGYQSINRHLDSM